MQVLLAALVLLVVAAGAARAASPCATDPWALQVPDENLVDVPLEGVVVLGSLPGLPDSRGRETL